MEVDGAREEAGNGAVNPKYPFSKHAAKLEIYICLPYRRIAVSRNCRIPYRRTRIAVSMSPYRCFIGFSSE